MPISAPTTVPGTRILGLGHYQPPTILTNDDLVTRGVDTNDEWVQSRVGIAQRHYAMDESVVDMAEQASIMALATSGVSRSDIDLVIVATCTMSAPIPNAAAQLATRLGINAPGAYDVNAACAGFVYAIACASSAVQVGYARNVLVVGAEKLTEWTDWDDRTTSIIWSDGAGAAIVGPSDEVGIGPVVWGSDGGHADAIEITPGTRFLHQQGQTVFRWATSTAGPVGIEACARAGIDPAQLDAFVPHQANLRIIESVAKKIGADKATVARDIVTAGNTSSASIPLAMSRLIQAGELASGSMVLILGFGAGLTYAGQVVLSP
jgi:3-oxoacyl-[acyl-carrier-protein] synthase III